MAVSAGLSHVFVACVWLDTPCLCVVAIPEAEPGLLPAPGVSHPGPHELHHQPGASRAPVRPHLGLGGTHRSW